jgi:hypothetical protein
MSYSRTLRNLAFWVLLTAGLADRAVLAYEIDDYCSGTGGCSCDRISGAWVWSGACDFSEDPDPEGHGMEFCGNLSWACSNTCDDPDYKDWLVEQWCDPNMWPPDPRCNTECWETFELDYCEPGANMTFSCDCDAYLVCEW